MANFQGHITTSTILGAAYGAAASYYWPQLFGHNLDWGPVFLGAGLTSISGMLPDLDSDSGIPVRELFGLLGAFAPFFALSWLTHHHFTLEQTLAVLGGIYFAVRYGLRELFKRISVHRGMFHSIPAMLIAGLTVFLLYKTDDLHLRGFLAVGSMLGFLSHLLLDEIFAVDLMGFTPKFNQFAGSAMKFFSASWPATMVTYTILFALAWAAWVTTYGSSSQAGHRPPPGFGERRTLDPFVNPTLAVRR
jgi:membrane-bound metal-dependent hydrolase YbcI (DUF457 family)